MIDQAIFTTTAYSFIAFFSLLISGWISGIISFGNKGVAATQHFAAGVVFAAVAIELLPQVVSSTLKFDIGIGFLLGMFAMLAIRAFSESLTKKNGGTNPTYPIGMITSIGIDLAIDGILIGLSFSASMKAGILVTLALTLEVFFLGLSLMPTMIKKNLSLKFRWTIFFLLASLIPIGAIVGCVVVNILPHSFFEATLSFGVAALLYLVTEELLAEAHEEGEPLWATASFFIGFLGIMLIS